MNKIKLIINDIRIILFKLRLRKHYAKAKRDIKKQLKEFNKCKKYKKHIKNKGE